MSKRRRFRPAVRIALIVAAVLLIPVGWAGYWVWWAFTAEPTIAVDYAAKLEELSASRQPEGPNAWPVLLEAASHLDPVRADIEAMGLEPREDEYGNTWGLNYGWVLLDDFYPDNIERERIAIEMLRERGVFHLLAEAAVMPRAVASAYGDDPLVLLTSPTDYDGPKHQMSEQRGALAELFRARMASMRLAAESGDGHEVAAAFDQTLFIASAISRQPELGNDQVSMAYANHAMTRLRRLLAEMELSAALCEACLDSMSQHLPLAPWNCTSRVIVSSFSIRSNGLTPTIVRGTAG